MLSATCDLNKDGNIQIYISVTDKESKKIVYELNNVLSQNKSASYTEYKKRTDTYLKHFKNKENIFLELTDSEIISAGIGLQNKSELYVSMSYYDITKSRYILESSEANMNTVLKFIEQCDKVTKKYLEDSIV